MLTKLQEYHKVPQLMWNDTCNFSDNRLSFTNGVVALSHPTASSAGREARGEAGSGRGRKTVVKPASMKQETSATGG